MHCERHHIFSGTFAGVAAAVCVSLCLIVAVQGQSLNPPKTPAQGITTPPPPVLAWDADLKEVTAKPGAATAEFSFSVTNISDSEVVILDAHASCGCTEARMPSKPWHLAAHSNGVISASVNLAGKTPGKLPKYIDVTYNTNAVKRLNFILTIPENPEMARTRNQDAAKNDRQAVFKGDCARCHVEPAKGKTGKDLFVAACDICHGANPRASMVPDLHALNHSTDSIYWKVWISQGKAGSMMPAFSTREGGPLTDEQIDSLAQFLAESIHPTVHSAALKTDGTINNASPAQKN